LRDVSLGIDIPVEFWVIIRWSYLQWFL